MTAEPHPNQIRTQAAWDAVGRGEFGDPDDFAEGLVVDNGPGAGPWQHLEGRDAFFEFVLTFVPYFGETWHQDGTCLYADDRSTISIVHETGQAPDGDPFDNMAIWVSRLDADGKTERIWTVDLDEDHVTAFWDRHRPELGGA